tara:strand:+ start:16375 stop:18750 length:2376 start_codon:yes stop_codon:yes gene_type:complete
MAFQESLDLLEWPKVCEQLSTFAITPQGKRNSQKLLVPMDIATSRKDLAETVEIGSIDEVIEGGLSFEGVKDIESLLLRSSKGGILSGEELLSVAETLKSSRRLRRQIDDPIHRPTISLLLLDLATFPELEKLLLFGLEEGGRVADRASLKLYELRRQWQSLRLNRRNLLQDTIRKYTSLLQDTVIYERYDRPVIAMKLGVSDQIDGTVHDTSSSGSTLYVEPQVVIPIGNRIADLERQILNEEQRLLAQWSMEVATNFEKLEHLCQVMLQLELALTRARYGQWFGGVAPEIHDNENAPFSIHQFRHPLLIWQEKKKKGPKVVPVSFDVSTDLRVVAITGPNTGGKTVTLKSVGLAILMTRFGFLLPCTGTPSLPWCSQVLADIGDEQSLQQNLSTFSGHVIRIGRILEAIDTTPGPSIVLLDEIGAGTDPTEGSALAIALLRRMADKTRLTIATTHFGELKALKYSDSRFENASVAFDSHTLKPTYHLQWGIPGRSNALTIALRLGLDSNLISCAQKIIAPQGLDDVDEVIKGLEKQRERQQLAAEDAVALLARAEALHEELLVQSMKQRQKTEEFQERGRQKLESSIREGQKEVRSLIRRLRDNSADGETARRAGQQLRKISNNYFPKKTVERKVGWFPKVGDRVRVTSLDKAGEVIAISEDQSYLTVLCGVFRSTVELHGIESLDGLKVDCLDPIVSVKANLPLANNSQVRTTRNTVDVRGLRVHEAETVVEQKLRHTIGPLWVIHGIGTGKLKRGLLEWLKTLPYVEKVVDADQKDGGQGCSVIWLD